MKYSALSFDLLSVVILPYLKYSKSVIFIEMTKSIMVYALVYLFNKTTIFQNSKNFKTFVSWSSSLISKKRNFDSVTANSLVY